MIPILAVDPSLRSTGWATHVDIGGGITEFDHGLITNKIRRNGRNIELRDPQRMLYLAGKIRDRARRHHARLVAIEGPSIGSNSSSADAIYGLHWHVRSTLWGAGIPYIVVSPSTIKMYATGYGDAPKRTGPNHRGQLRTGMVDAACDDLTYRGDSEDVADAMWLHALVADALGQGYTPDLGDPRSRQKRRDAIATVVPLLPRQGALT